MAGTSPAMTECLLCRRARPGLLCAAQALERLGHAEHADIVEAAADDLRADGKAVGVEAACEVTGKSKATLGRY